MAEGFPIDPRDLPAWAKPYVEGRPHVDVVITDQARIPSNWCDWNVRRIILRHPDGRLVELHDSGYDAVLNDPHHLFLGKGDGPMPEGGAILITNSYPKNVRLYVRRWDFGKAPPPTVSKREAEILDIVGGTKGGQYRREELRRARVRASEITALIERGFLNRQRALTLQGRQARVMARYPEQQPTTAIARAG